MSGLGTLIFAFLLVFGLALLGTAIYGFHHDRPALSAAVLVGTIVLIGTFYFHLYQWSSNTQLVVAGGLLVSTVPAAMTWFTVRYASARSLPS